MSVDIKELLIYELKNQKVNDDEKINRIEMNLLQTDQNSLHTDENLLQDQNLVNVETILNLDKTEIVKAVNPKYKKAYILLDRRFRASESLDRTTTTWYFQNNNNIVQGSVNALGAIRDIVSMRIYDMNMNIIDTNYISPQSVLTVFIPEFSAQSFIGPLEPTKSGPYDPLNATDNSRFHFWGTLRTYVENLTPPNYDLIFWRGADLVGQTEYIYRYTDGNNGLFEFTHPITTIDKISVSFGSPYRKMPLPPDTFNFTYLAPVTPPYGTAGGAFSIRTSVSTQIPYGTYNLDRIYISNFMTDNPVADKVLIELLNNPPYGIVYVGEVSNPFDSAELIIYPPNDNIKYINFPPIVGTQTSGTIYFDFYRFYVPLELTYMVS